MCATTRERETETERGSGGFETQRLGGWLMDGDFVRDRGVGMIEVFLQSGR
jgi:hypothetical protein